MAVQKRIKGIVNNNRIFFVLKFLKKNNIFKYILHYSLVLKSFNTKSIYIKILFNVLLNLVLYYNNLLNSIKNNLIIFKLLFFKKNSIILNFFFKNVYLTVNVLIWLKHYFKNFLNINYSLIKIHKVKVQNNYFLVKNNKYKRLKCNYNTTNNIICYRF